jgi:hypothetical protein
MSEQAQEHLFRHELASRTKAERDAFIKNKLAEGNTSARVMRRVLASMEVKDGSPMNKAIGSQQTMSRD